MSYSRKIVSLLLATILICLLTACNNTAVQSTQSGVSEKESKDAIAQALTDSAIEEFIDFTKIPRPCYHTEKALEYLINFAEINNFEHHRDEYGNFWMDVPASEGYEAYPKVILQGHMDMVCAGETGKEIDFENVGITAVVEGNTITADGTSLGADNGIAVGIMLALAKSDVSHGPLRYLITTDEDVGLLGAAELPAEALDADYLINIDAETLGQIIYSTAGDERVNINRRCQTTPLGEDQAVFSLSVSELIGGHSGVDINKNRLSANVVLIKALEALILEGIGPQLISADCGTASGAISPQGTVVFAVPAEKAESVAPEVERVIDGFASEYKNETINFALRKMSETGLKAISSEETSAIIEFAASFPQGVIAMSDRAEDIVATSFNFGMFTIVDGLTEIIISFRSCINADIERLEEEYRAKANEIGFDYGIAAKYPGYDGDPNAPLPKLTEAGYSESGIDSTFEAIHAGLECSWFASLREGIQMVSIGPTIKNAHTVNETLYIDTVKPVVEVVLYCLENINTLE